VKPELPPFAAMVTARQVTATVPPLRRRGDADQGRLIRQPSGARNLCRLHPLEQQTSGGL